MNTMRWGFGALAAALALVSQPGRAAEPIGLERRDAVGRAEVTEQRRARDVIDSWPEKQRRAAELIINKYGQPDIVTRDFLLWRDNGPWRRTIAFREGVKHNFPMPHEDSIEQFVKMRVPLEFYDDLAKFDGSVYPDRTRGEISAKCDKEAANFLALNLAKDIIDGKRTVADARRFYADTIASMMAGKQSEYLQRLRFRIPFLRTADPDERVLRLSERDKRPHRDEDFPDAPGY